MLCGYFYLFFIVGMIFFIYQVVRFGFECDAQKIICVRGLLDRILIWHEYVVVVGVFVAVGCFLGLFSFLSECLVNLPATQGTNMN